MRKKILNHLIIVILLASISFGLIGCSKATIYDPDNFLTSGTESNPYQIVKDSVTIDIFVPRGSMNPSYSSMKMFTKLSAMTNLKFNFIEADTSSYTNLRSAAWENKNDLPDLFLFSNTVSEQVIYSQYDALVTFNDDNLSCSWGTAGNLINNYMPNYKTLLANNFGISSSTNAVDVATLDDGFMYSTLTVNNVPRDLTFKMFLNQVWIDNLNTRYDLNLPEADEIKTIEEYIMVLRAFKQYDANANGDPEDEIPVTAKSLQYLRNFILASYGYVSSGIEITEDGGSFVYTPTTEVYKKYLDTMSLMFSEGLIDNNTFSILSDGQMAGKGFDGRLGSFCSAAAYITVGYDLESNYVTFGPLTSSYYNGTPLHFGFTNFAATGAVIPSGTPYVREIARLLDIMYSDIGCQLIAYGEEGVDWTWDNDEKTSWTFIVPDTWTGTQEEYRATITPNVGTGSALYWNYNFVGKMSDSIIKSLNSMSEIYMPYLKVPIPEEIKMTADEYDKVVLLQTTLDKYIEMMECSFVKGDKKTSTDWTSFQNDLKNYKYQELLNIYNNALGRYNAK
jgi:putative aldouronate transport system substrate-binding protein